MDAIDRALHDRSIKHVSAAIGRAQKGLEQTAKLAVVGDMGSPPIPAQPELLMMLAGVKRIDRQLDVLNVCLGQLARPGGTAKQQQERVTDVAEQVALVQGIWWGVEQTVTHYIDPDFLQNGTALKLGSGFSSPEREGLYRELKLGTEARVSALSAAFQTGDISAVVRAAGGVRLQLDRARQAIVNVQLMPHRNGHATRPLAI
jgi:hypothetical protein